MADYPTDDELQRIKDWPFDDTDNVFAFVKSIWHWPDFGVAEDNGVLYLATGGWSGNEDIIEAMLSNIAIRCRWICSTRGGAHEFEMKAVTSKSPDRGTRFKLAKKLQQLEARPAQMHEALAAVRTVLRATRDFTTHRPGCDKLTAMNCACGFDLHGAVYKHALAQAEAALKEAP